MRHALLAPAVLSVFLISGCADNVSNSGPQALPTAPLVQHPAAGVKPRFASQPLLYVTNSNPGQMPGTVDMYYYPSLTYAGQITGFNDPLFMCLGKRNSVFVVDYATGQVANYNHAATSPNYTLTGLTLPYQCAYNRQTKDLAVVANIESPSEHIGYVAIYHHATGTPHLIYDRDASVLSGVIYDAQGNLYVDGYSGGDTFYYARLDVPESTFDQITLQGGTPAAAGPMYFDPYNDFIDVGDFATKIYQVEPTTGSTATVANIVNVAMPGSTANGFTVPSEKRVIVADAFVNEVLTFKYPHGGTAIGGIESGLVAPWDVILSKP